jgi:carotenoid 1,2-hydratase
VEVALSPTHGKWSGEGYLDSNWGAEPIEDGFEDWDWSRAHLPDRTLISYDVKRRGGDCAHLSLAFDPKGEVTRVAPPPAKPLAPGLWRMPRWVRPPAGAQLRAPKALEDTPFYTRTWLSGEPPKMPSTSPDTCACAEKPAPTNVGTCQRT